MHLRGVFALCYLLRRVAEFLSPGWFCILVAHIDVAKEMRFDLPSHLCYPPVCRYIADPRVTYCPLDRVDRDLDNSERAGNAFSTSWDTSIHRDLGIECGGKGAVGRIKSGVNSSFRPTVEGLKIVGCCTDPSSGRSPVGRLGERAL